MVLNERCSPRYLSTIVLPHCLLPSRDVDVHRLAIHLRRRPEYYSLHFFRADVDVEVSIAAEVSFKMLPWSVGFALTVTVGILHPARCKDT